MSADLLREAANLMRIRAKNAKTWDGNWQVHPDRPGRVIEVKGDGWDDAIVSSCVDYGGTENGSDRAPHIASWHPAVALAVADSLIAAAAHVESYDCEAHCEPGGCELVLTATRTARAYLGGAA